MFIIEEELKKIPDKPGVYIMYDKSDTIIYVGKAKVLSRRVKQYFQSSRNHSIKIQHMVERIVRFEYIITDSETEALVLESNLIKENRPKYNTMLKDDKSYPFIKVTVDEEYPRIMLSRDARHGKSRYFGPFTSSLSVKETIDFLCRIYKIRTCSRKLPADIGKERPCLNYHIGKCLAPCAGYQSAAEYTAGVEKALRFLKGDHDGLLKELEGKMRQAAENMEYEDAAVWRDLTESLKEITKKQKITADDDQDRDIAGCAVKGSDAVIQVFFIRGGKLIGRDHFHMSVAENDAEAEVISQFLKQYYGGTPFIPPVILLPAEIEDEELIASWLSDIRGQKVSILTPKKGMKERLVSMATDNARLILEKDAQRIKLEEARTTGALKEIENALGLVGVRRVEAFDISNTSGVESVGSMVVFEDGKPRKHDYRKFRIKTVKGPDDYKSMKEVLERRLSRGINDTAGGFARLPDLILMDGGKGQVNVAEAVLKAMDMDIPVAGMVKDEDHRTRGLYYHNKELPIDTGSEGFKLITRIQDEAHRFAIEYHRKLRGEAQVKSVLDDIEGIGPVRRRALMMYFKDIEAVRNASVSELAGVEGMTEKTAQNVYAFFH